MEPTKELIDALYAEEIRWAREMPPEDKFWAGARLFDMACRVTLAGIRHQFPDADEEQARQILADRLALVRRLEQR